MAHVAVIVFQQVMVVTDNRDVNSSTPAEFAYDLYVCVLTLTHRQFCNIQSIQVLLFFLVL